MKILLAACNAKYIHSNPAVYDLRAFADCYRDSILLREYTINQTKDEVMKDIFRSGADIVCFSCYIWNISYIRDLLPDLKKILPGTAFWAGGPEVSFDGENFLKENPSLTGIMMGEGESTFLDLAAYYLEGKGSLEAIPGIIYRRDDKMIHNGLRELMDLSQVPFTYEHVEDFANRIIYYESSRGCPFSCSYCLSSVDKKLRFRELSLVKKELQFFLDKKVPQVKFVDRTFNCRHDHAMEIWQYIYDHDNGITNFHFEICAETIGPEHLEVIKNAREGLFQFEIGIQSTNPKTLSAIRRSTNVSRIAENVKALLEMKNSHIHVDLIAGLPFEDFDTFRNSFNDVYTMGADNLQLGFLKLLKGTNLYKNRENFDIIYRRRAPYEVISTKFISSKELARLKMIENVLDLYHNRGGFDKSVSLLIEKSESAFDFFDSLAEFYYGCGYQHRSHKKEDLYRILNAYGVSVSRDPAEAETIRHAAEEDLCASMNSEAVKKFMRKGWEI